MPRTFFKHKIFLVLFGIFLCLILLELGLRLGGGLYLAAQEQRNSVSLQKKDTYRILCLGESTTAFGGDESYPRLLENILNQNSEGLHFSVINKGIPSITTDVIIRQLNDQLQRYHPDMVITMMGINDEIYGMGRRAARRGIFLQTLHDLRIVKLSGLLFQHLREKFFHPSRPMNDADLVGLEGGFGLQGKPYVLYATPEKTDPDIWTGLEFRDRLVKDKQLNSYQNAVTAFQKARLANRNNEWPLIEMGLLYIYTSEYSKAEQALIEATRANPGNDEAWFRLGMCYKRWGRFERLPSTFAEVNRIAPQRLDAYMELINFYEKAGAAAQMEQTYQKAVTNNPSSEWGYAGLMTLYEKQGRHSLAEQYRLKLREIEQDRYNTFTRDNYLVLNQTLSKEGILHLIVQYPMRSVQPLEALFDNPASVHFVDNEKVFREAVLEKEFETYFKDRFAGEFGHCTSEGNRLLAGNIASQVMALLHSP